MQKLCVIGRVIKNIELKYTKTGKPVAVLPIVINDVGNTTTYINFITYEKVAINVSTYLQKGSQVYIEAVIKNDNKKYEDKMFYDYKFYANYVEYLDRRL